MTESGTGAEIFRTNICLEEADDDNPYVAQQRYIHGYSVDDLWQNSSFVETLLLLFTGQIPKQIEAKLFERLLIGLMNLGPREVSVRAAMTAGISRTAVEHLLPIGLIAGGGENNGANEVKDACKFIIKHSKEDAVECAEQLITKMQGGYAHVAPGFGGHYGTVDPILARLAGDCFELVPESRIFNWCRHFNAQLNTCGQGWLASGLVAAVCCELAIKPTEAITIYQLCKAPGIAAQGVEQTRYPTRSNPLLADEHYDLDR